MDFLPAIRCWPRTCQIKTITKTAVFIGYSLEDPDFRQIWRVVSDRLGRTRRLAYALVVNARASDIARFERRGVKVINLPGTREKYGEVRPQPLANSESTCGRTSSPSVR